MSHTKPHTLMSAPERPAAGPLQPPPCPRQDCFARNAQGQCQALEEQMAECSFYRSREENDRLLLLYNRSVDLGLICRRYLRRRKRARKRARS